MLNYILNQIRGAFNQGLSILAATIIFTIKINAQCLGPELIVNGDFTMGNTGFTTGYTNCTTSDCLVPLANNGYSVGTTPSFFHYAFAGTDHTSGTGNMMIINGGLPTLDVWSQTVTVTPFTTYSLSAWVSTIYSTNPARLDFLINGTSQGTINAPATTNTWINFLATWNSGISTSAVIRIVDINNSSFGNDFGLDDISFRNSVPTPTISAEPDLTVCKGGSESVNVSGANSYTWQPSSGLSATTGSSVTVSPTTTTTYTITGTTYGCSDVTEITVTVNDEEYDASNLLIPNCFTPNNDGINDIYKIPNAENSSEFEVLIFNRWGEQISRWTDTNGGWDGMLNGKIVPEGVYCYIIKAKSPCNNQLYDYVGTLTLLR